VSDVAAPGAQQRVVLRGLLEQLGLRPEVVRNVIMTRDIVPRAFVCDYTMIAEMLKSWMPSFKEHVGLAPCKPHKVSAGQQGGKGWATGGQEGWLGQAGNRHTHPALHLHAISDPWRQLPSHHHTCKVQPTRGMHCVLDQL
jgi:hypothetical protein